MKILLLNPNHNTKENISIDPILTRCVGIPAKAPYLWPPIGLAYLAAYLRQGFDAEIIDAQAESLSTGQTLRKINHDLVFVNAGTPTIEQDISITKEIKKLGAKTVLIGTHATHFHKELIKNSGIDFIIRGEPERPSINLIGALNSNKSLSRVAGLTWKIKPNESIINRDDSPIEDLNKIPIAARDLLPNNRYYDILTKKSPTAFVISSRGCPFSCRFCSAKVYSGRTFRARSAENTLKEIDDIIDKGFNDITFFDDTFTINKRRVLDICRGLKERNIPWRCLSRTDTVDRETLKKMKDSGCYQIQFGVESGDSKILKKMNKGTSLEQTKKIFSWCDDLGIETVGFFILGYPGESIKSIERTISFAHEIKPDFVTFNLFTPIPGSEDFKKMETKIEWKTHNFTTTSFCSIPSDEISSIVGKAYRNYYIRPSYLLRRISKTKEPLRIIKQNLKFWIKRKGVLWRFM